MISWWYDNWQGDSGEIWHKAWPPALAAVKRSYQPAEHLVNFTCLTPTSGASTPSPHKCALCEQSVVWSELEVEFLCNNYARVDEFTRGSQSKCECAVLNAPRGLLSVGQRQGVDQCTRRISLPLNTLWTRVGGCLAVVW